MSPQQPHPITRSTSGCIHAAPQRAGDLWVSPAAGLLSLSQHRLAPFRPQPHPRCSSPTTAHNMGPHPTPLPPHRGGGPAFPSRPLSLPAELSPARTQGAAGSHLCLSVYKSAPARCLFTSGAGWGQAPTAGAGPSRPEAGWHRWVHYTRGGPRAREAAGAQFVAWGRWQESIRALAGRGPGQQGCSSPGEPAARTGAQNHAAGASRFLPRLPAPP